MDKNKMLIDATHPEETRVVVLRNGRVEEFDYESAARKLLRGNIYLAKVTRVEPSLQAAFIEYGGNRHGFLAFGEIHPDYYQIPVADRQVLLQEEADAEAAAEAEADARAEARERLTASRERSHGEDRGSIDSSSDADDIEPFENDAPSSDDALERDPSPEIAATATTDGSPTPTAYASPQPTVPVHGSALDAGVIAASDAPTPAMPETVGLGSGSDHVLAGPESSTLADQPSDVAHSDQATAASDNIVEIVEPEHEASGVVSATNGERETIEQVGSEDALEEVPERSRRRMRQYKIQEVIKRRQIMLVQVVKEERGNKGAALTTYLSLAGRYTVLMPNTGRGGGISRKITQPQDRKRLKAIAQELDVPEGMGLIIRTAGASRTKQEIKRDYEYLLRLWENVRDLTLQAIAPCLVYEEGDLIKRSIRDLYAKDIGEILVAGEHAYREANDFMRMLMPSHVQNVVRYDQPDPLFARFQIERQLNAMFSPFVTLRSGGYLVVNQTEALVAIDVNSGKSTREFSIEETALNTNLEAAEEIARQLKLRDLAGLIVIDFIDMEEKRNNRSVERRLKDALRFDRARIQVGRISHFGLLEMSRQRLRTGVLEGSTSQCPHCMGTGVIRSTESVALAVLRGLEDHLLKDGRASLVAVTTTSVALYILNQKRTFILDMEARYGVSIAIQASERMQGANFTVERSSAPMQPVKRVDRAVINMESGFEEDESYDDAAPMAPAGNVVEVPDVVDAGEADDTSESGGRSSRRRRRRRGRRDAPRNGGDNLGMSDGDEPSTGGVETVPDEPDDVEVINAEGPESGPDDAPGAASRRNDDQPERNGSREARDEGGDRRGRRRGRRGGRGRRDRPEGRPQGGFEAPFMADEAAVVDYERVDIGAGPQPAMPMDFPGMPSDAPLPAVFATHPADETSDRPSAEQSPAPSHRVDAAPWDALTPAAESAAEPHVLQAERDLNAEPASIARRAEPAVSVSHQGNGVGHEEAVTVSAEDKAQPAVPTAFSRPETSVGDGDSAAPAQQPAAAVVTSAGEDAKTSTPAPVEPVEDDGPPRPARKGWWQRKLSGL